MKLLITAQGPDLDSEVDPRFGRASNFLVLDTDTDDLRVVDNSQNLNAAQGAGVQAAQNVAGLGVSAVLTGHCGPKAFQVLQAAGIRIHLGAAGTVREALRKFRAGEYAVAGGPDVDMHW
jgi:predicted Fe-Mo cluster-binding NifX family protein